VRLIAGFPAAQVFSPPGAQFICFEPMTAPTNALRCGAGLGCVPAGGRVDAVFAVEVAGDLAACQPARTAMPG
jgi:aldose 1-epimerase